jgi:ElaB/YqjD/DUF883 family membrane-anchored ribosome-binding protein
MSSMSDTTSKRGEKAAATAAKVLEDLDGQVRQAADQWRQGLEQCIQEKPIQTLLVAAGVGLLLGLLIKR